MRLRLIGRAYLPAIFAATTIPAIAPTCANCGNPATMSPIAYTPGSSVCCHWSVLMNPRSGLIFVFSRPMSAVRGERPTATSTFSASFTTVFPSEAVNVTFTPVVGQLHLLHLRAHVDVDAPLAEAPRELLAYVVIFVRHQPRQVFDNRDFRAKAVEDAAELHADSAGANHDQRLGNLVDPQNFDVGQNARIHRQSRQHLGIGARRQQHVLRLYCDALPLPSPLLPAETSMV